MRCFLFLCRIRGERLCCAKHNSRARNKIKATQGNSAFFIGRIKRDNPFIQESAFLRAELFTDSANIIDKKGSGIVRSRSQLSEHTAVTALFLAACCAALYMPSVAADGIRSGVEYSLNVLLPSLFPFMFLSAFAAEYGISSSIGRITAPFTEKVLYLPQEAGVTVLLSLIGGYPVGAIGIASLLKNKYITEKQAARMLCFCINPGPAFLISAVGDAMYGSKEIGLVLLCSQTLSSLLIGAVLGLFARKHEMIPRVKKGLAVRRNAAESFILSSRLACGSAVSLCTLVVLFSAFSSLLLGALGIDDTSLAGVSIRAFLEVTDGCSCLYRVKAPVYLTALAVGWGGLCVHFQIFAALPELKIGKTYFFVSRLCSGTLGAALSYLVMRYANIAAEVFSNTENTRPSPSSPGLTGSCALLLSSVMFVVFIGKETKER